MSAKFFGLAAGVALCLPIGGVAQKDPAELVALRAQFEQAKVEKLRMLKQSYGQTLKRELEELTKAGNLEEALAFKREMDAVAAELLAEMGAAGVVAPEVGKNQVDILALADPAKHGRPIEKWAKVGKNLECVKGSFRPKMILPYQPPAEYDYSVTFSQPRMRNGVALIFPNGAGKVFDAIAAGRGGSMAGLSVDGRYPDAYSKMEDGWFTPGQEHTLTVKVREAGVLGMVDGKEVFRYKGPRGELRSGRAQSHDWPDRIALCVDDPAVITRLVVTEITGRGRVLR